MQQYSAQGPKSLHLERTEQLLTQVVIFALQGNDNLQNLTGEAVCGRQDGYQPAPRLVLLSGERRARPRKILRKGACSPYMAIFGQMRPGAGGWGAAFATHPRGHYVNLDAIGR